MPSSIVKKFLEDKGWMSTPEIIKGLGWKSNRVRNALNELLLKKEVLKRRKNEEFGLCIDSNCTAFWKLKED